MARKTFHCISLKSSHWAVQNCKTHGDTKSAGKGNLTLCLVLRWKPDCTKILVPDPRIVLINSCKICVHVVRNQPRKSSPPAYHMTVRLPLVSWISAFLLGQYFLSECPKANRKGKFWIKKIQIQVSDGGMTETKGSHLSEQKGG